MSDHDDETTNPDAEPDEAIDGDDDQGDDELDDGTDAPPDPALPSTEATMAKADKENRRYMKALDRILGPDEARHECAACNGLGVSWEAPADTIPLVQGEDAEPCPDCLAYGEVLTGSKNPAQMVKPCAKCGGRGWREHIVPVAFVPSVVPADNPAAQTLQGQYVPGRGFIPYGSDEPLPGSLAG